jgi:hypothetical protein
MLDERRVVVLDFERTVTASLVSSKREAGQSWAPCVGEGRLPCVRGFLRALGEAPNVDVVLMSTHCTEEAMAECLQELELAQHVSVICDCHTLAEGNGHGSDAEAKQTLLSELVLDHSLQPHEILAIDADGDCLRGAPCRTLHVEGGRGVSEAEVQRALIMLGLEPDH